MQNWPGHVILLNGASSAGKSSVAWHLQRLLPEPHLFAGIDSFTPMLRPDGHIGMSWDQRTNENAGGHEAPLRWVFPERDGEPVALEFGERGQRLIRGMHRALAALALAGNDVIFEHVLLYEEWLDDLLDALEGVRVYFVAVRCPIDVIEERERSRSNRVLGQARSHHETAHAGALYDVEVDTSVMTPRAAAEAIAARVTSGEPPDAFERMRALRGASAS
ncbi:MAG: AAA family ATPase [Dehalococcoidia bacterium]